jgi:hypothetical protein
MESNSLLDQKIGSKTTSEFGDRARVEDEDDDKYENDAFNLPPSWNSRH